MVSLKQGVLARILQYSVLGGVSGLLACATPGGSFAAKTLWSSATALKSASAAGCRMIKSVGAPADVAQSEHTVLEVTGEGGCRLGPAGSMLVFSVPAGTPRLLGHPEAAIVHPGDTLELEGQVDMSTFSGVDGAALDSLLGRLGMVDPRFSSFKGTTPAGTKPLRELETLTHGVLKAEGIFDEVDGRASDAAWLLRVLTRAGHSASMTLALAQTASKDGGRSGKAESSELRRNIQLSIQPADKPLRLDLSELELFPPDAEAETPLVLGEGDFCSWTVAMGTMSRLGSETRGPAGATVIAGVIP